MKIALVVGCAENVWDEVEAARRMIKVESLVNVYCVKMIGIYWPEQFKTWVTLHPEFMDAYKKQRRAKGLPDPVEIVCPPPEEVGQWGEHTRGCRQVSHKWPGMDMSGSSGLFAAKVALDDGFDKALLAGIPMLPERGHFRRKQPWLQRDAFMRGWEQAMPFIRDRVRSPSGWTREILGEPTEEWLGESLIGRSSTSVTASA